MKRALLSLITLMACAACAQVGESQLDKVRKDVSTKVPGVTPEMVTPSAAPGLYQVRKGGDFGYITSDGRYLITGDLIDLVTGELISEVQRGETRRAVLSQFGPDEVIEFAPKDPKYFITVFTDIDCGFCRKLHAEMGQYHAEGIGVRYLFLPRSGPNTLSFQQAEAVFCSANRREALTQAKRGVHLTTPSTCANPVLRQYQAADAMGINATPTLILPSGDVARGYVPAKELAARLASVATTATR